MFPFVRLFKDLLLASRQSKIGLTEEHVSHHIIWPWDLDAFLELNNGRTLTIYDLGRLSAGVRSGLVGILKDQKWGLTMAGSSVRYRRRLRMFAQVKMRSRAVCWDDRFIYIEQSMWNSHGECANHVLYRAAATDKNGIVSPDRILTALGEDVVTPPMPDWIKAWVEAEALRPWPPMQDETPTPIRNAS